MEIKSVAKAIHCNTFEISNIDLDFNHVRKVKWMHG